MENKRKYLHICIFRLQYLTFEKLFYLVPYPKGLFTALTQKEKICIIHTFLYKFYTNANGFLKNAKEYETKY